MCMFCLIQKWSRRVATMLPWLVIPLIGLWGLSQLLPPAFRFEITSPRLACVFVLLVTLFWYEVLMPQLTAWRVRRNARLIERKRFEAFELQKMKKTATRKCRNCLTPYKDQNPGGGKFMCSYCGHISKRPVLDLPVAAGMSSSGLIKELFGKGGKILNGKDWSDNVSLCNQELLENENWVVNNSFPVRTSYPPRKNGIVLFRRSDSCLGDMSYSVVYFFSCKLLTSFLLSIQWLWRKVFGISSEDLLDAEHRMSSKKDENGGTGQESRGEKARRKAEEKRQARLEKELLEVEERKQREDVARLVEDRRRLRDEKIEAENRARGAFSLREKDSKKEAERRRQERSKEKDKANFDVDELDRKTGKQSELKRESDRKIKSDRRASSKTGLESVKSHHADTGRGGKGNTVSNFSRGNVGSRYFDRVRGTFLSSSKAFSGSGFFGKAAPSVTPASKDFKPNSSGAFSLFSNSRYDFNPSEHLPGKTIMNGEDKVNNRPVTADTQRKAKQMSWHQLFTRTSPPSSNVISRPSAKSQVEGQSYQLPCPGSSAPLYDNPIDLPSPFILPTFSSAPLANISGISVAKDPLFSCASERPPNILYEEPELFEDPCYVPDPVLLLGPVSESLDNFQLDHGGSYAQDEYQKSCPMINVSSPPEVVRPSPIDFPLSRRRVAFEKQNNSSPFSGSAKALDMQSFPASDLNNSSDIGTWHMWNSSLLGPDGLCLLGSTNNWITSLERSSFNEEMHHSMQENTASLFSKDDHVAFDMHYPQKALTGNVQIGSAVGASVHSSTDQNPWPQNAFSPLISASESYTATSPTEPARKKVVLGSSSRSATNHAADPFAASCWLKNEWSIQGSGEGVGNSPTVYSNVDGLHSTSDVT